MKKFLFLGAIAAMLLGTTACSNDMEPELTDGTVQFKVELPGAIESRAISDGMTAKNLTVAVYDAQGAEITELQVNKEIPHETTVQFKLVKGQTYSFAFWAQNANAPYDFDTEAKSVSVSYENATCNDEARDAFYAYKTLTVDGPINQTVYLTRPFAQLNFGADDLAAAAKAGITPSQSQVVVSKVGTAFNLATGKTEGEKENVTFKLAAIPTDTDPKYVVGENEYGKLVVNNKDYGWMAMNYFLAPGDDAIISATMTVKTNKADVVVPATNVPVKKNHRTNIVGSLFTEDANFNVIIDQNFDTPDYNVEPVNPILVKTEDELKAALNKEDKNIYIKLLNDVDFEYGARKAYGNANTKSITIDGNGHTLNLKGTDGDWSSFGILGNGDLTLKNMTVYKTELGNGAWNNHAIILANRLTDESDPLGSGKIYLQNVHFNNAVAVCNDAVIEDCQFVEPGAFYTLIIRANVQNTTVKNCTFTATNGGRGIKVMDEYLVNLTRENGDKGKVLSWTPKDGSEVVQCKINVSNCTFHTASKAAILVSNVKGANIIVRDLDIANTIDPAHAVWVDEDWSNYDDQVIVDPQSTCIVEP